MADLSLDTLDIHSTDLYLTRGYPFAEWDLLRRESPIHWYERDGIEPFWAITRHADVLTISKHSEVFVNSRRLRLQSIEDDERQALSQRIRIESRGWDPDEVSDFILMDDPRHRAFRLLVAKRFTPAALRSLEGHFARLSSTFAREFEAELLAAGRRGETTDFVKGFAEKLPLSAIGEMMGLPDGDWRRLKQLTNVMIGAPEKDFYREGETRNEAQWRAVEEMTDYMVGVVHDRRKRDRKARDLSTQLVHAKIDGVPLTEQQLQGYLFVLLAAGNETTQNAISGGVAALLEHRDQLELLCSRPDDDDLIVSTAEEILRWTSPVLQFARTAVRDFELDGVTIREGEAVGMWYPAANRDPAVFDAPYRFDITRNPNRHLAFGGYGAHFCLGANLARWELRAALRALIPVLPKMERAGGPERCPNLHVSAIHRLEVQAAA
ncbi:MAG TPA: cytochrome P450 [Myxococcota bacterium]|nr:cytochrome P450 [Myxococcota bacterium]